MTELYPKPQEYGGQIIRKMISRMDRDSIARPRKENLWVACSGGADSVALLHLLARYGRRVVQRESLRVLHINHYWRGKESNEDAEWVRALAEKLELPCRIVDAPLPSEIQGESLESLAREQRQKIFGELVDEKEETRIMTAHHADDQAVTLLWRLLTGNAQRLGKGILSDTGRELRPLLDVRKSDLIMYLREEGLSYRIDSCNEDLRFQRVRVEREVLPPIEAIFPRAVEHLVNAADGVDTHVPPELEPLIFAAGLSPRRNQWIELSKQVDDAKRSGRNEFEIQLKNGWVISRNSESWSMRRRTQSARISGENSAE